MVVHNSDKLSDHISALIRADGPLTVARYMSEVLNNPTLGYYANNNPIGELGDFVTAPEISQMYGELVGAWLIDCWERLGKPDPVVLVELGPGRGTFISDFWRVATMVPKFSEAVTIYLVESSPVLREQQKQRLQPLVGGDAVSKRSPQRARGGTREGSGATGHASCRRRGRRGRNQPAANPRDWRRNCCNQLGLRAFPVVGDPSKMGGIG